MRELSSLLSVRMWWVILASVLVAACLAVVESSTAATPVALSASAPVTPPSTTPPTTTHPFAEVRLAAAGDIACEPGASVTPSRCQQGAVAGLIERSNAAWVLPLGDLQYPDGSIEAFQGSYDASWGRFAARSLPAVGNHEYRTVGADGYFEYWREKGIDPDQDTVPGVPSWYRRYVGAGWMVIALDSNCGEAGRCDPGGAQLRYLHQILDRLADNPCVAVTMHHPRFTVGDHPSDPEMAPIFDLLASRHVPLVLAGHNHHYERIRGAGPSGTASAPIAGSTVEVVVGTGGMSLDAPVRPAVWDASVINQTFGALLLDVTPGTAAGTFVGLDGRTLDSFRVACSPVQEPAGFGWKAPIVGFIDRQGQLSDDWAGVIRGVVVDVPWAELQPVADGDIAAGNAIDQTVEEVRAFNARHPDVPVGIKVRVRAGIFAPEWLKQRTGKVRVTATAGATVISGDTYLWWKPDAKAAYDALMAKLAIRYDADPLVREVQVSRCTTVFEEPFLRQRQDPQSFAALLHAGLTAELDATCHREELEAHRVWANTYSALAVNPYQNPDQARSDVAFTIEMMQYCREMLGWHCLLENHSMRDHSQGPDYEQVYQAMQTMGRPLAIQTAAPEKVGALEVAVDTSLELGAEAIELPRSYRDTRPEDFRAHFAAALADLSQLANAWPTGLPPVGAPTDVTLDAPDTAEAYLLGSIWSDGFAVDGDIAAFSTSSEPIAASIDAAARTAGWRFERRVGARAKYQFRFPDVSFAAVNYHGPMPGMALDTSGRRLVAWMVGDIQSEGGRDGLVLDDPYRDRAEAMSLMLDRLGLANHVDGTQYFRVFVEPSAWPVFKTWPFVVWSRVPGA